MFRQHSATGLLAIFQVGSSLAENWLMYGIDKLGLSARPWRLYMASCLAFHLLWNSS